MSGFLITALLVEEYERRGRIHIGNFYARRALRLLPPLFTIVALCAVYAYFFPHRYLSPDTLRSVPYVLLYVANYRGTSNLGLFGHTWSLGLEEQFYILWPALMIAVLWATKSYKWLFGTALTLAIASTAWRFALVGSATHKRFGAAFDVRAAGLLFGCAAAVAYMRSSETTRARFRNPSDLVGPLAALALLLLVTLEFEQHPRTTYALPLVFVELAALGLILHVVLAPRSPIPQLLSMRAPVAIGRISYGLYLWHFPAFAVVKSFMHGQPRLFIVVVDFAVAFALAACSFRFIEAPALRLKSRLAGRVRLDVSAPE